jgi:Xaa-Pro aminopeptidase
MRLKASWPLQRNASRNSRADEVKIDPQYEGGMNMDKVMRTAHYTTVIDRLRDMMSSAGLDALIVIKNENFTYINTLPSAFLQQSGMASVAMIVVPVKGEVSGICCDFERPALESGGTVSEWHEYPMWIFIDDQFLTGNEKGNQLKRSEFFELSSSLAVLMDRLRASGVEKGKLGLELGSIQVPVWEMLRSSLPQATFVDSTSLLYNARAVKTPYEIECLRYSAKAHEEVIFSTMADVTIGMSHAEILSRFRSKALSTKKIDSIRFMFISIGALFAPCMIPYDVKVRSGDLIKYDGALVTGGYGSDMARTFIVGDPSYDQQRVNRPLVAAHMAALDMMGPGVLPKDVFNKAMQTAHENGLPHYSRGHVGHSVGLDQTIEEPPFLSGTSEVPMVPGNVFCVELPYYAHNFGSIMNEDIVLITEDGKELLTIADRKLHSIGIKKA